MTIVLDQSLVGGWIVRAGDQVVDLSARGRLEQLATELRR
jgi:F-type H+-transporting ATPase subunit delta